jgi:4-hydroxy-2-oxoheptanedioate aldolase
LGFDWLAIDLQHGFVSFERMVACLQALTAAGAPGLVRVPANSAGDIGRALDWGAEGVIVPMVNTRAEAEAAVRAMRYPPAGARSWGAVRSNAIAPNYTPSLGNQAVICVLMLETREAISNSTEIASVEGVDALLVGPSDLAVSIGIDPSVRHESVAHQKLLAHVVDVCDRQGVVSGIVCSSAAEARSRIDAGFKMIGLPSEADLVVDAATALLTEIRNGRASRDSR